jgi:hypothetical protein
VIEDQSYRLAPRRFRARAARSSRDEGRLEREVLVFRRDLNDRCTLDVQPTFAVSPNTIRSWSDKSLSHTPEFATVPDAHGREDRALAYSPPRVHIHGPDAPSRFSNISKKFRVYVQHGRDLGSDVDSFARQA